MILLKGLTSNWTQGPKPGYLSEQEKAEVSKALCEDPRFDCRMWQLEEAFGTADFAAAVYNAAHTSMMKGYGEVEPVWKLVSSVVSRNDFKTNYIKHCDGIGLLEKREEHEQATMAKPTDIYQTYQLYPYDKVMGLSMEAWANDELGILQANMRNWGHAAVNTLNDFVWGTSGLLGGTGSTVNLSISGSTTSATFNATNYTNYYNVDLSYANLQTAIARMRNQTDQSGTQKLGVTPYLCAVSPDTYAQAIQLTQSDRLIAIGVGSSAAYDGDKNPWKGSMKVVMIDSLPTTEVVLAADPNRFPCIEMGFYQGKTEPTVMFQGPDSDAEFFQRTRYAKCQLVFGGQVMNPKCFYKMY